MTLNYIQDETEILNPGQSVFLNIDLEEAYKIGLKKRPIVKIIPKVTKTAYTPTINKPKSSSSRTKTSSTTTSSYHGHSKIIRQWVFKEPIKNRFYAGHCTWGAAIITPEIFPYVDKTTQVRPFGGNANQWYDNARNAGFSVGKTPRANSLVIYQHGSKWVNAGHVGRVIAYYPEKRQMIVRDMNRKGKFIYTDRRESIDNSNIKGYIYIPATPRKPPQ
ncbi:MAG: CHAP domain-containing protein [bacterium]|nr:CHAP domain-containing protein [bacterium]